MVSRERVGEAAGERGVRLVVDALNVIGTRPTGWWRDRPKAIRELVAKLRAYARRSGRAITVVIDGRPLPDLPEGRQRGVEVLYARRRGPDAADDRIVELLESAGGREGPVEVATADRGLRDRLAALGVPAVSPAALLRELDRSAEGEA